MSSTPSSGSTLTSSSFCNVARSDHSLCVLLKPCSTAGLAHIRWLRLRLLCFQHLQHSVAVFALGYHPCLGPLAINHRGHPCLGVHCELKAVEGDPDKCPPEGFDLYDDMCEKDLLNALITTGSSEEWNSVEWRKRSGRVGSRGVRNIPRDSGLAKRSGEGGGLGLLVGLRASSAP